MKVLNSGFKSTLASSRIIVILLTERRIVLIHVTRRIILLTGRSLHRRALAVRFWDA